MTDAVARGYIFTEEELPKGKLCVVGRSLDGAELACILPDTSDNWTGIILGLRAALKAGVAEMAENAK